MKIQTLSKKQTESTIKKCLWDKGGTPNPSGRATNLQNSGDKPSPSSSSIPKLERHPMKELNQKYSKNKPKLYRNKIKFFFLNLKIKNLNFIY